MKITKVEPLLLDRFCYVRIETDQGITGLGESGTWGQLEATAASIAKYAEYLEGKDPRPIEHHWNVMLRANHFTGGAISGAVSAIDIALWDIKGKLHGVPVYELLGGRMRHKARLYGHVKGRTAKTLVAEAKRLKAEGFTALGHLNPLLDEDEVNAILQVACGADRGRDRHRPAVARGSRAEVDLCIEIHRRLTPPEAIALGRGIEKYTPMFFEDPLRPNSFDAMAWVADHIPIPVATGERFVSLYQFQTLLSRHAVQYLRPDVCLCGGSPAPKRSQRWPRRMTHGSCRTIRCRRSAPRRACKSPPVSRTSQSRNTRREHRNSMAARSCWAMIWRQGCQIMKAGSSRYRMRPGSASNSFRTWRGGFRTGHGRSGCGRTPMGPWSTCKTGQR